MDFLTNNFVIVISVLTILGGLVVFGLQISNYIKSVKTNNWTETTGIVSKSELEVREDISNRLNYRTYRSLINYTYNINAVEFESSKIYYGDNIYTTDKWQVESFLNRFPVGQKITVYINPINESESLLIKGVRIANILYLIISILIIGIGTYGLIYNKSIYDFLIQLKSN